LIRRTAVLAGLCSAALVAAGGPAQAATGQGCQLSGTQTFSPGLTLGNNDTTYTWQGTLGSCQGNAGALSSATVSIGEPVQINGVKYLAPDPASASGANCDLVVSGGTAIVQWAGGGITVVGLTADGTGLTYSLSGTVVDTIRLTRVDRDANGNKVTDPISTTVFKGGHVNGLEQLAPTSAPGCASSDGLGSSSFSGALGFYTTSS
jgi:hypothetical protein